MTIEFLRARLLSERSVSKAVHQQAQQLKIKVADLERQLEMEIQLRKRAETVRLEAIRKLDENAIMESCELIISNYEEAKNFGKKERQCENGLFAAKAGLNCDDITGSLQHEQRNFESFLRSSCVVDDDCPNGGIAKDDKSRSTHCLDPDKDGNEDNTNCNCEVGQPRTSDQCKGILIWETRRGVKKLRDNGPSSEKLDRIQTSELNAIASASAPVSPSAETGHRRWIGKSVRQIKKREMR
eukprot:c632_g1_i1 orf=653-1375(-)